jgi:small subunit ribosomal protein S20
VCVLLSPSLTRSVMPNTASAKKRLRQDVHKRDRNRVAKSQIKTEIRKVLAAVAAGDLPAAREAFRGAAKRADRAAARKVIHPNRAARLKSRLSARIKALVPTAG